MKTMILSMILSGCSSAQLLLHLYFLYALLFWSFTALEKQDGKHFYDNLSDIDIST